MDSDIRLNGNRLVIEGDFCDVKTAGGVTFSGPLKVPAIQSAAGTSAVRFNGPDLMLDNPERRTKELLIKSPTNPAPKSAYSAYRRAIVHDPTDGLTLNWGGDYPGGVTINGPLKITDAVRGALDVKDANNRSIFTAYADYNALVLRNKAGADNVWIHSDLSNGGSGIDLRNKDGRTTVVLDGETGTLRVTNIELQSKDGRRSISLDGEAGTLRIHNFYPESLDLGSEIRQLHAEIATLKQQVAALQSRP